MQYRPPIPVRQPPGNDRPNGPTTTTQEDAHHGRPTHHRAYADVYRERMRQLSTEGFSRERDDGYVNGQLGFAAASYAYAASLPERFRGRVTGIYSIDNDPILRDMWPAAWSKKWWKPTERRRDLVKAGALILAEIERLDRATERQAQGCQACDSVPGQHHSPECPAVNAFTAGRIPPAGS